jgi:hypothetical protein
MTLSKELIGSNRTRIPFHAPQSVIECPSRVRELQYELRERNAELKNLADVYATVKRDITLTDTEANTLRQLNCTPKTQLEKATQRMRAFLSCFSDL